MILELMERLADMTADEIAEYIRSQGVTGKYCSPSACPVTNLVRHVTGAEGVVTGGTVMFAGPVTNRSTYALPRSVTSFIRRFDCCAYPDLAVSQ